MQSAINFFILVSLAALASIGFAQEAGTLPETVPPGDANEISAQTFPYVAQIIADDVYIRSGPGTHYYTCGRLNKADRVTVVGSQFSWSRIVPPAGSFSWISARYVSVDPNNPGTGIVAGNAVQVYVGSDYRDLMRCTTTQLRLNKGEKVKLMGQEKDNYYKIAPPTGVYRWVSTKYTKSIGPVGQTSPTAVAPSALPTDTNDTTAVVPTKIAIEANKLTEYYALEKQMEAERAKPIDQQDYSDIKKAFLKIAGDKEAGKAARYSEFAVNQIERFELALEVAKAVRLQDARLRKIKDDIAKAKAKRLAEVQGLGRFAVIGQFQISKVYVEQTYQVVDDSGKITCYALPTDPASQMDLSKFVDRKVGLVGTIEPHVQTAGALVRFAQIVELK